MNARDPMAELESAVAVRLAPFVAFASGAGVPSDDVSLGVRPEHDAARALAVAARRIAREIDVFAGAKSITSVELDWQGPPRRLALIAVVPGREPDRLSSPALESEIERALGLALTLEVAPVPLGIAHIEPELRASTSAARTLLRLLTRARSRERGAELSVRDEEVHQLRVGFRRMRGAARMLRSAFAPEVQPRFERAMEVARVAMRRAGAVRDLDVLLDDLRWAEKRAATPDESTRAVRDALHVRRDKALGPMRRFLASKSYAAGIVRLEQLLVAIADDHEARGRDAFSFARKRLRKEELRCRTAIETLDPRDGEQAHAIRIAAKRMRYCAELVTGAVSRAERIARAAGDVQSVLGRERDAVRALSVIDEMLRDRKVRATAATVAISAGLAMRKHEATSSVRWALAALKDALE